MGKTWQNDAVKFLENKAVSGEQRFNILKNIKKNIKHI